jgi:hypothetical protein
MFKRHTEYVDPRLDSSIDEVIDSMKTMDRGTKEYAQMNESLVKLLTLKQSTMPKRLSHDTLLLVSANLAGIIAILSAENTRVVASKAIGFVLKAR